MSATTDKAALEAIVAHHRVLESEVDKRAVTVATAARSGSPSAVALAALLSYFAGEVLPHALAEEQTIYAAARERDGLVTLVDEMTAEHRGIERAIEGLALAHADVELANAVEYLATTFRTHVAKENEALLPALVTDESIDLAALLGAMGAAFASAKEGNGIERDGSNPEATLVALLLKAVDVLADTGHGELAGQLAASAWAALGRARPDLAVRVNAALHRLARAADDPAATSDRLVAVPVSMGTRGGTDKEALLDVRTLAPAQRHEEIFTTYYDLAPGGSFVLVNDHDPKPLRFQLEAEHADDFTWETLESGPETWRVRIGRPPAQRAATSSTGDDEPELDVRELPHARRHEIIFSLFEEIEPGRAFVLVNDHDPKPLRLQFDAIYDHHYSWEYFRAGPDLWRIQVSKIA